MLGYCWLRYRKTFLGFPASFGVFGIPVGVMFLFGEVYQLAAQGAVGSAATLGDGCGPRRCGAVHCARAQLVPPFPRVVWGEHGC